MHVGNKVVKGLTLLISLIFLGLWSGIIILNFFFSYTNYSCKKTFILPNILLLILGLLLMSLMIGLISKFSRSWKTPSINKLSVVLFLIQAYVFYNVQFHTNGWDPWEVYWNADLISKGQTDGLANFYFSSFPNNQFIVFIQSLILRVNRICGVLDKEGYMLMNLIQCTLCTLTGKLLFEIIEILTESKAYALTGWIFFVILLGLSGWNVVTYTDMMGLIFPTAILRTYLSLRNKRRIILKWTLIFALVYWGFKMKPTAGIMMLAILIAEGIHIIGSIKKSCVKEILTKSVKIFCAGVMSVVIYSTLFSVAINSTGLIIDKEANTGALHMVMMGMNPANDGVWYGDDVSLSQGITNKNERTKAQIGVIKQRLSDYGVKGFIRHMCKKSLIIFNDGTFAWGSEGGFYDVVCEDKNEVFSPILKSLYYNGGSRYLWLSSIEQMAWIVTLFLSVGITLNRKSKEELAVILSLVGIIIFNFMFEARARYIMLYVPIFILAALMSFKTVLAYVNTCVGRLKSL